jgi:hypothetical protein
MSEDKKMNLQDILNQEKAKSKIHKLTERQINHSIAGQEREHDEVYKEKMAKIQASTEYKEKLSNHSKEKWQDKSFKTKRDRSLKEWASSEERRKQVSEQMSGKPKSVSQKKKMSEAQKAFNQTKEGKRLIKQRADAQRGIARKKVVCPHCGKEGGEGIMIRWHFDNCKHK